MSDSPWNLYDRDCPSRELLDRVASRWTILVVGALHDDVLRFSDLLGRVDGISHKMLARTLRMMEEDGLVVRTPFRQFPRRVEYELTEAGQSLRRSLQPLQSWLMANTSSVVAHRRSGASDAQ